LLSRRFVLRFLRPKERDIAATGHTPSYVGSVHHDSVGAVVQRPLQSESRRAQHRVCQSRSDRDHRVVGICAGPGASAEAVPMPARGAPVARQESSGGSANLSVGRRSQAGAQQSLILHHHAQPIRYRRRGPSLLRSGKILGRRTTSRAAVSLFPAENKAD